MIGCIPSISSQRGERGAGHADVRLGALGQLLGKAWNFETPEALSRQLDAEDVKRLICVGDAQMITRTNLERIAELR
jgi:hypothetical protein